MSKFRLKMATQLGEQVAKDHGFESLPIDPFRIAAENEIVVQAKPSDQQGVSGCIVFHDDRVGIIYSTHIKNEGFINFTIAHELGHYFLDGHPEEICKFGPMHVSRAGFSQGDVSIEIEADHFASGLLLPAHLVKSELQNSQIGLEGIINLAEKASCSMTAAAIRVGECAPYPVAVIVSQGNSVCYSFLSEGFKSLKPSTFLRKGHPLPNVETKAFNCSDKLVQVCEQRCSETTLAKWFGSDNHVKLDEEIVGLGKYGLTLTVLSSEELPEEPYEFDDEEAMLEHFLFT